MSTYQSADAEDMNASLLANADQGGDADADQSGPPLPPRVAVAVAAAGATETETRADEFENLTETVDPVESRMETRKMSIEEQELETRKNSLAEDALSHMREQVPEIMDAFEQRDIALTTEDIRVLLDRLKTKDLDEVFEKMKTRREVDAHDREERELHPTVVDASHYRGGPKPMTFSWQNIYFRSEEDDECYLSGVSGYLRPGHMLVLLGAPDCQMDTLLRVLGRRTMGGDVSGTILVDGQVPGKSFKQKVSYVPKFEVCLPTITVQETLLTSYRLRLPETVSDSEIFFRMLLILKVFGLLGVRPSLVGDTKKVRGISGGERRRLSFCQEVAGFASILLADLPTNGLDSATAFNLCKTMKTVTQTLQYSCMFTLAQPAPELLALFDDMCLLSKGRLIYFGPVLRKSPTGFFAVKVPDVSDDELLKKFKEALAAYIGCDEDAVQVVNHEDMNKIEYKVDSENIDPEILNEKLPEENFPMNDFKEFLPADYDVHAHEKGVDNEVVIAKGYFEALGFVKPSLKSDPDWLQELTGNPTRFYQAEADPRDHTNDPDDAPEPGTWQDLVASWKDSHFNSDLGLAMWNEFAPQDAPLRESMPFRPLIKTTRKTQISVLVWRQWNTVLRNLQFSFGRVLQLAFAALFQGSLFYDLGDSDSDMLTKFSALFIVSVCQLFLLIPSIPFLVDLWDVHVFQTTSHYYYGPMFYIAFMIVELFWLIWEQFGFAVIFWAMVNLNGDVLISEGWWYFYMMNVILNNCNRGTILAVTAACGSSEKAHAVFPIVMYAYILTAGFLIVEDEMNSIWIAILYVNPLHYHWKGVCINEFFGLEFNFDNGNTLSGEDALKQYGLDTDDEDDKYNDTMALLGLWFVWQVIGMLTTSLYAREHFTPTILITDYSAKMAPQKRQRLWQWVLGIDPNAVVKDPEEGLASYQAFGDENAPAPVKPKLDRLGMDVTLVWKNLNYGVTCKDPETNEYYFKHILHDVYGFAQPGSMVALMGATGAGKSTLMDVLADYKTGGDKWNDGSDPTRTKTGPFIWVNGYEMNEYFPYIRGYVEQFDSHEESMTVRQSIEFSALLRLPTSLTAKERDDRVEDTLDKLELQPIAHQLIGNDFEGGISPEYRKKVTIGVELVVDPGLLFLDEPTTGLDSASAYNVMQTVQKLSTDMAVVCTIHQPSKEVFQVFDVMMLLKKGGHVVYFGPVYPEKDENGQDVPGTGMAPYFKEVGFPPHDGNQNLADYAVECAHNEQGKKTEELFKQNPRYERTLAEITRLSVSDLYTEPFIDLNTRPGWVDQVRALYWRYKNRDLESKRDVTILRVLMLLSAGLIFGWCFWDPPNTQEGTATRNSVLYMSISMPGFTCQQVIPVVFGQRPYIFRETKGKMYRMSAYVVANLANSFPIILAESLAFTIPCFWMCNLRGTFFEFWLPWTLAFHCSYAIVDLWSSLVPTQEMADSFCSLGNGFSLLLGGYLIPYENIPVYWVWIYWGYSPLHYAWGACMLNEYDDHGEIEQDMDPNAPNLYTDGDSVLDQYDLDDLTFWEDIMILCILIGAFRFFYILAVTNIQHIKR